MQRFAICAALLAGCYRPDVESCVYACAAGANACPSGLTCDVAANRCVQPGDNCNGVGGDGGADGGGNPTNFYAISWGAPVALTSTADPNRCEYSPVLDEARNHLVFSRPIGDADANNCPASAELVHYAWNDGNPTMVGKVPNIDGQPGGPLDLASAIVPGTFTNLPGTAVTLIYVHRDAGQMVTTRRVNLTGDLEMVTGASAPMNGLPPYAAPSFDKTYMYMVFGGQNDIYEGDGTITSTFSLRKIVEASSANDEGGPAISPDGRVMVFWRFTAANDADLMVSRRTSVTGPWEMPMPLPLGNNQINIVGASEFDPVIATNGDLIFSSTREASGKRRLFLSRAQF